MELVAPEAKIWIGNNIASLEDKSCPELDVRYNGHFRARRFMARLKPLIVLLAKRKMEALRMAAFSLANIPTPATLFLSAKYSGEQSRECYPTISGAYNFNLFAKFPLQYITNLVLLLVFLIERRIYTNDSNFLKSLRLDDLCLLNNLILFDGADF